MLELATDALGSCSRSKVLPLEASDAFDADRRLLLVDAGTQGNGLHSLLLKQNVKTKLKQSLSDKRSSLKTLHLIVNIYRQYVKLLDFNL